MWTILHKGSLLLTNQIPMRIFCIVHIKIAEATDYNIDVVSFQIIRQLLKQALKTCFVHLSMLFLCISLALHPDKSNCLNFFTTCHRLNFFHKTLVQVSC